MTKREKEIETFHTTIACLSIAVHPVSRRADTRCLELTRDGAARSRETVVAATTIVNSTGVHCVCHKCKDKFQQHSYK